uniref:Uncharacterized protein n=1 Tax=Asparagus officinalis TaxID=4686 RepID=Q2XNS2_ASPOF|nr:hypothetical protein 9.t00019 [Asparagus officinalis]
MTPRSQPGFKSKTPKSAPRLKSKTQGSTPAFQKQDYDAYLHKGPTWQIPSTKTPSKQVQRTTPLRQGINSSKIRVKIQSIPKIRPSQPRTFENFGGGSIAEGYNLTTFTTTDGSSTSTAFTINIGSKTRRSSPCFNIKTPGLKTAFQHQNAKVLPAFQTSKRQGPPRVSNIKTPGSNPAFQHQNAKVEPRVSTSKRQGRTSRFNIKTPRSNPALQHQNAGVGPALQTAKTRATLAFINVQPTPNLASQS